MGIILPNSSRVSLLTYKAIVAVRYPELVLHDQDPIQIGHFVPHDYTVGQGGFRTVLWEVPKYSRDLLAAIEDIVVFLNYLQKCYRDLNQGATAQLLVMCNRTAVHTQLLQHGFQAAWFGGLRIATNLISSRSHGTNSSSSPDRMWVPQWGPARCNDRRQRGLLWTSHCRAHQGHPAYVHCLPH